MLLIFIKSIYEASLSNHKYSRCGLGCNARRRFDTAYPSLPMPTALHFFLKSVAHGVRRLAACRRIVLSSLGQLGGLNGSLYCISRMLQRLSADRWDLYKYQFVAQTVAAAPLCGKRGRDIHVYRYAHRDELPCGYPRPAAVLRQRDAQGAVSLAAFREDCLAGFLWILFGGYQEDEVRARYILASPHSSWDFDVWIDPEERLGLTFARLWDEANLLLRARAVRWTCSRISAFNSASLRAHGRIGTVRLGTATFLRCGRWQWMCATLAPYLHLSWRPNTFPRLVFDTSRLDRSPD